jgi:hypothetical protein
MQTLIRRIMQTDRSTVTMPAVLVGTLLLASAVSAGEQPFAGRYINHPGQNHCSKLEDKEGHLICSFETLSVGIRDNGEMYTRAVTGTLDWVNGAGPMQGYVVNTYADGSTLATQWQGFSRLDEQQLLRQEGTLTCIGGTGRFAGAKCEGMWTGMPQKGGFTLGDYKGTMTLPDR